MDNTLSKLFDKIKSDEYNNLKTKEIIKFDGIITNISLFKDKTAIVNLLLESLPSANDLIECENIFEKLLVLDNFKIKPCLNSNKPVEIEKLMPWLIKHLEKEDFMTAMLFKTGSFLKKNENEITLRLQEGLDIENSNKGCKYFERFVKDIFGLEVKFKIEFVPLDLSSINNRLPKYEKKVIAKIIKPEAVDVDIAPDKLGESVAAENIKKQYKKNNKSQKQEYVAKKQPKGVLWGRVNQEIPVIKMNELNHETGLASIEGRIFEYDSREISNKTRVLVKFCITDKTGSIKCTAFMKPEEALDFSKYYKKAYLRVLVEVSYDAQYEKDLTARVIGIQTAKAPKDITDYSQTKRIELHTHTKMSSKDAVCDVSTLINKAAEYGHEAIAITDHGVVQSFPNARQTLLNLRRSGKDIKVIYGMECYLANDGYTVAYMCDENSISEGFVALSILHLGENPENSRVNEVSAIRFKIDEETGKYIPGETFHEIFNHKNTEYFEFELNIFETFEKLENFIGNCAVVGRNILNTMEYLRYEGFRSLDEKDPKLKFFQPAVEIEKAQEIFYKNTDDLEKLNEFISSKMSKTLEDEALSKAYEEGLFLAYLLYDKKISNLAQMNELAGQLSPDVFLRDRDGQNHCIILAKDLVGLYGLYRMVSHSHLKFVFKERPRVTRSMLEFFRSGCILGSACEAGELFQNMCDLYDSLDKDYEATKNALDESSLIDIAKFYDYLEIQPIANNYFMLRSNEKRGEIIPARYQSEQDLINLNKLIFELGTHTKRAVCATCDVHFLRPEDQIYRQIMQDDMGFSDANNQPPLFFRTTEEMLSEFMYLGEESANEVVIQNPKYIDSLIQNDIKPFPEGTFPPVISTAAQDVENITWETAKKMYEKDGVMPDVVLNRIKKELKSIIGNGFAVMYYISYKLVKKSNEDGYIVGSRGSVGSSLVATLCNITEVNPLPPHYYCPDCRYSEFFLNEEYQSGYDLPEKLCPSCNANLIGEGQDIPFETFLGFEGEKQPDIDLNFSGEYQPNAHKYTEEMFGSDHTYRAGTISGYAQKNAIAMVNKFCMKNPLPITKAESLRLSMGLIGVKRTTGQHPGGIVVVPKDRDIYEFTPVQCPADKTENAIITTHFDFNSLHDTILKLDILGHDDPTMLKVLGDMTGVNVLSIPVNDKKVMDLFTSNEPLELVMPSSTECATLGLPELGTFMARGMIKDTKPTRFYDLVQLMGLSHGTDVWKGNAQDLIKDNICSITEVIGCRDSIMTSLMHHGLPSKDAFTIMEKVRKGKGITPKQENLMREKSVPEWYIESCKKIKYMFPKAHAAAYSISALRIAWFKVYKKEEYYCAFFTIRADEFDGRLMCKGFETLKHYLEIFRANLRSKEKSVVKINGKEEEFSVDKTKNTYYILELIEEMYCRGVEFLPIDIYKSDATKFIKEDNNKIRPPLNTLPSVSSNVAENIVNARNKYDKFISREDFAKKCLIGDSVLSILAKQGCLDELPETTQIDLFSMLA